MRVGHLDLPALPSLWAGSASSSLALTGVTAAEAGVHQTYLLGSRSLVGATVIRLGLSRLCMENLLNIEAVTALSVMGLGWVKVLAEDVVRGRVGVRGARVLRHIAKLIVTQILVNRGSRRSRTSE